MRHAGNKKVTLSFDNGPDPGGTTNDVLNVLASRNLRSTFFVLGQQLILKGARECVARAHSEGHWIGNHTFTHSVLLGENDSASVLDHEIGQTQALISEYAHDDRLFRPYGGGGFIDNRLLNDAAVSYLAEGRYTFVLWTSVPRDWEGDAGWVDRCIADIEAQDWAVVVLHDLPTDGMRHLPVLLDRIAEMGVEVVQEFPPHCTPIRKGTVEGDLSSIVMQGAPGEAA